MEGGKKNEDGKVDDPPIPSDVLDSYLRSHCISPAHIRADDFDDFMKERRKALLTLIGTATGHPVNDVTIAPEEGEELSEEVARDSGISTTNGAL